MDNYAKILMKKLFLTIIIAFATVCSKSTATATCSMSMPTLATSMHWKTF